MDQKEGTILTDDYQYFLIKYDRKFRSLHAFAKWVNEILKQEFMIDSYHFKSVNDEKDSCRCHTYLQ